jgi:hypothetical protein
MDYGRYTGKLGYELYNKYNTTSYNIFYAHEGNNKKNEPNLCKPTPFFDQCSRDTTLSYVDIAIFNEKENVVKLIAEIEESGAEPKKIIGDIVNVSISDQISIKSEKYNYSENLVFILGVIVNAKGSGEEKARKLQQKLTHINQLLGKKIELIFVIESDLDSLITRIKAKIEQILDKV